MILKYQSMYIIYSYENLCEYIMEMYLYVLWCAGDVTGLSLSFVSSLSKNPAGNIEF